MKKFLMTMFALFTLTIAAIACNASAFCKKYESVQVKVYKQTQTVNIEGTTCSYQKNPYANSQTCAPDMNWASCYEYCFSYKGKTYFFNACD